jgi:hypothetical protein
MSFKFEYLGEINFVFETNLGINQGTGRVPLMKGPKSRATVHLRILQQLTISRKVTILYQVKC